MTVRPPTTAKLPPIPVLLGSCGPIAVARRVVAVVVASFQHHFPIWSQSHISHKRGKGITPLLTHLDPATSVVTVVSILRILTATDHCAPSIVLNGPTPPVCDASRKNQFSAKTPARLGAFIAQSRLVNCFLSPAVAFAQPSPHISTGLRFADHDEPSESLATQVHSHSQNCITGYRRVAIL